MTFGKLVHEKDKKCMNISDFSSDGPTTLRRWLFSLKGREDTFPTKATSLAGVSEVFTI